MDWTDDLETKFGEDEEMKDLQKNKFFGHITINFFDGKVVDVNKYQTRKPIAVR